jgi:hypothetical protein
VLIPGFDYIPKKLADDFSHHLCGILTVFHLAGITDPAVGFLLMLKAGGRFKDILEKDLYTGPQDMQDLCELLGLKTGPTQSVLSGTFLDPKVFHDILDSGGKILVVVNIDANGVITDPRNGLGVGHWVSVESMWVDSSGVTWVEVYNPYTNQYEAYRWDTLAASMQQPGKGNEQGGFYIPVYPPATNTDGNISDEES